MRELTASPIQLDVMAIPIAVPVMRGKTSPSSATVVGKTGAMAMPAKKVRIHATVGFRVCNMAKRQDRHQDGCGQRDREAGDRNQNLRGRQPSEEEPQRESERQNVERSNLRHALRDQVLHQPIPHAHLTCDVQEQQQSA